jgi:hypothetical protein
MMSVAANSGAPCRAEQFLQHFVLGHAQANGFALGVAHPTRHFLGGFQNEGERPGCGLFDGPKLPVVHPCVVGQLAQVAAQQRQVVFLVHSADAAQLVGSGFIVQVADQGVAGVGGHGQHAALVEQLHGLLEQTRLRVVGVNAEKLGHGCDSQVPVLSSMRCR